MLKKHYIENISSRDQSLVRMGTSRVTLVRGVDSDVQVDVEARGGVPLLPRAPGQRQVQARCVQRHRAHHHECVVRCDHTDFTWLLLFNVPVRRFQELYLCNAHYPGNGDPYDYRGNRHMSSQKQV